MVSQFEFGNGFASQTTVMNSKINRNQQNEKHTIRKPEKGTLRGFAPLR